MNTVGSGIGAKRLGISILMVLAIVAGDSRTGWADTAAELDRKSRESLAQLRKGNLVAHKLAETAKGILVFPDIVKAGFLFGAHIGEGAMIKRSAGTVGYYNSVAASYGLQAGIQKFGFALFFMDDEGLKNFQESSGFEIGVGPSVVIVDQGVGKSLTTTTVREGIYAFIFDQTGLMAGMGIQGSKITKISK
jgi:lipid-binding SYLF domain-containing protein